MMVLVMVTVELGMVTGAGEEMEVSVELGMATGAGEEMEVSVELGAEGPAAGRTVELEVADVGERERWKDDENGYHGNELHKLKMFSVLPTLSYNITQVMLTHMQCPSQAHKIYYTSSYFFLLLLLSHEGGVVDGGGALVLLLLSHEGGGGRGIVLNTHQLYIRVTLGVERSCSKLELKIAIMETLNTLKHEHCRL